MGRQSKVWEKQCIPLGNSWQGGRTEELTEALLRSFIGTLPDSRLTSEELKESSVKQSSFEKEMPNVDSSDLDRSCFKLIFPLIGWLELLVEPIHSKETISGFIHNILY